MADTATAGIDLRELLEAGCHFGHQSRRWNPKMDPYIFQARDGVHILDLAITAEKLTEAMDFVQEWVASGHEIVFVGTKRQAKAIVREEATKVGAPYVTERWLGGTITNWKQMKQRIDRLNMLKEGMASGEFGKKYTKRERVLIEREIARLERFFGGISHLTDKPEALFVVDTNREEVAVKEAVLKDIPVVGMIDTNGDPDVVSHLIPVNDDAVRAIKLIVTKIAESYAKGKELKKKRGAEAVADTTEKTTEQTKQAAAIKQVAKEKMATTKKTTSKATTEVSASAKEVVKPARVKSDATKTVVKKSTPKATEQSKPTTVKKASTASSTKKPASSTRPKAATPTKKTAKTKVTQAKKTTK